MKYLKNAWYPFAWNKEVSAEKPMSRTVLDTPVVAYRNAENAVILMHDMCPHRAAPLSKGRLEGSVIHCPYHGLAYNQNGKCVHNPQGGIPRGAEVQTFPCLEKYSAIWIWMGDPAKADANLLPEFEYMHTEQACTGQGYLHVNANYLLEIDNILDLSHIEFLHPIFSSPAVSQAEATSEVVGESVWSKRNIYNDTDFPDFIRESFGIQDPNAAIDRWLDVRWDAPALMKLYAGGVLAGRPREEARVSTQVHWFTPETATSTHYFYGMSMPKHALGGEPQTQQFLDEQIEQLAVPFKLEDKPILEAQQLRLGDRNIKDVMKVFLPGDSAALRAQRILAQKIEREAAAAETHAAG